jgi:hypothetical protein
VRRWFLYRRTCAYVEHCISPLMLCSQLCCVLAGMVRVHWYLRF